MIKITVIWFSPGYNDMFKVNGKNTRAISIITFCFLCFYSKDIDMDVIFIAIFNI